MTRPTRYRRSPTAPRFWAKVHKQDGACWLWQASTTAFGYGVIWCSELDRQLGAHQYSWLLVHGSLPVRPLQVLHRCDVPACVNPDHLFVGTQRDNIQDCLAKGRQAAAAKTHCKHGHALTSDNLYPDKRQRRCRTCTLRAQRLYDQQQRDRRAT